MELGGIAVVVPAAAVAVVVPAVAAHVVVALVVAVADPVVAVAVGVDQLYAAVFDHTAVLFDVQVMDEEAADLDSEMNAPKSKSK